MRPIRTLSIAIALLLLLAGCSTSDTDSDTDSAPMTTDAPSSDASDTDSAPMATDAPSSASTPHATDLPDTDFAVEATQSDQHGLEVAVTFNVHRQPANNDQNVVRAVASAVESHPDYDLIIVQGYSDTEMTDGTSRVLEAWYKPEHVAALDLDSPAAQDPYADCYSCLAPRH